MIDIYLITAQKVLMMFILIALGFIMRRKNLLPEQSGKVLSILTTNIFLPAMIFNNLSSNLSSETAAEQFVSFSVGVGAIILAIAVAKICSTFFGKTHDTKSLFTYIFAFSNYAYFGYPVIESVFGAQMLAHTIIFAIPFTITIFTYGVHLLTGEEKKGKMQLGSIARSLLKPVLIAVILGISCGLLSVKVPKVIADTLTMASSCMSPVSMILTGFVLAAFPLTELFKSLTAYIVALVRLVAIPAIFACVLWLAGLRGENYIIPVILSAMPVGMNVIVFAEADGKDSKHSARICFVSYVISLFTIPLVFGALYYLK